MRDRGVVSGSAILLVIALLGAAACEEKVFGAEPHRTADPTPSSTATNTSISPLPSLPPEYFFTASINAQLTSLNSPRLAGTTLCPFQVVITVTIQEVGSRPSYVHDVGATLDLSGPPPAPLEVEINWFTPPGQKQISWTAASDGTWEFTKFEVYAYGSAGVQIPEQVRPLDPQPIVVSCAPTS